MNVNSFGTGFPLTYDKHPELGLSSFWVTQMAILVIPSLMQLEPYMDDRRMSLALRSISDA